MALLRYISHPNVAIDPEMPVTQWRLSDVGEQKVASMLGQPWVAAIGLVVSSAETKAIQTAMLLANHVGVSVDVRPNIGEIDRNATGFVPHDEHEALADKFFSHPTESAAGWETAVEAQRRIVDALADLLVDGDDDVAVAGHGGTGTLLLCHLAGLSIDRMHDQPGQGHYWTFDRATAEVVHRWQPVEKA